MKINEQTFWIDNSKADVIRAAYPLTEKVPTGWKQKHVYTVGDSLRITAYVWGDAMDEMMLERIINDNLIFACPAWR